MWNFEKLADVGNKVIKDVLFLEGVVGIGVADNKLVVYITEESAQLKESVTKLIQKVDKATPIEYSFKP